MPKYDLPHIVVQSGVSSEPFSPPSGGGSTPKPGFKGDRSAHGTRLIDEYESALGEEAEVPGSYVTFESFPGIELALDTLDPRGRNAHPELVAVKSRVVDEAEIEEATVFIPDGTHAYFLSRLESYAASVAGSSKAKHAALVESISRIRQATLRDLWTDSEEEFPQTTTEDTWWELWWRSTSRDDVSDLLARITSVGGKVREDILAIGDRSVTLVWTSANQLAGLLDSLHQIAELRKPHVPTSHLVEMDAIDQTAWAADLAGRVAPASTESPYVTVLDRGIQQGHMLLKHSLEASDCHAVDLNWTTKAVHAHATEVAGIALYGDLERLVLDSQDVRLTHRLESVKILPDTGGNEPELYGALSARAIDRVEIAAADRRRTFMMAVTSENDGSDDSRAGRPTAWSATLDALAFGRAIDDSTPHFTYLDRDSERWPRLVIVSAGNIRNHNAADPYPDTNTLWPIEDPAQAWNALTVGAVASSEVIDEPIGHFDGWNALVPAGELAPTSRTSTLYADHWPFKPEVVAPGGNAAASPDGTTIDTPPSLALLTTRRYSFGEGPFTTITATSAATAFVANIAAQVQAAYPELRPETVRGLVVHSARWTPQMRSHLPKKPKKSQLVALRRQYGMGVPDADRALHSARDALSLISEEVIHPFERTGNVANGRARELRLHNLPWPKSALEALGEAEVKLRVTLSYFVEPNPSRRGWNTRYAYQSHGLRFDVMRPEETLLEFEKRVNKRARGDGENVDSPGSDKGWRFGSKSQSSPGSLHSDVWQGTAQDLASRGAIVVYPVVGWWKDRREFDQSDDGVNYSLVVSIESPVVETDLWTPVATQVNVPIEIGT